MGLNGEQSIERNPGSSSAAHPFHAVPRSVAISPHHSTVLVTGATGFVGSAIGAALRARGHAIRALARPTSPRTNLNAADVVYEGDLRDRASLAAALKGARYLFHAAADYRLWARDPEEIAAQQSRGNAARHGGGAQRRRRAHRLHQQRRDLEAHATARPRRRTVALAEGEGIGAYKRSKVAAERLVEAMIQRDGLPAVIVNPSTPIGPRDVRPTPTGRIIVEAASGRMPAFVDTGLNLAHVDDVAAGHVAALDRGRIGERYILGGENVFLADMLADIAASSGGARLRSGCRGSCSIPIAYGAEVLATPARRRAVHHNGRPADGAPPYVLRRFQGAARAGLCFEAVSSRALPTRSPGFARTAISNDCSSLSRLVPLAIWAYLLFGRGWFWLLRRARRFAPPTRLSTEPDAWPSVVAIIPARDEAE